MKTLEQGKGQIKEKRKERENNLKKGRSGRGNLSIKVLNSKRKKSMQLYRRIYVYVYKKRMPLFVEKY